MQRSNLASLILGVVCAVSIVVLELTGGMRLGIGDSQFNLPFSWLPIVVLSAVGIYQALKLSWKANSKLIDEEYEVYEKAFRASVIQIIKEEFPELVKKE
jgi:hypothetical protein